jgi:hypothetical protein
MNWKFSVICISLSVMACGAQALPTQTQESVNKDTHINTQISIPVNTATMTVCTDALNIRPKAGDLSRSNGQLQDGDQITVKLPAVEAGGGMWYELVAGGFVNGRYVCE